MSGLIFLQQEHYVHFFNWTFSPLIYHAAKSDGKGPSLEI
jgi:hypothetical protein